MGGSPVYQVADNRSKQLPHFGGFPKVSENQSTRSFVAGEIHSATDEGSKGPAEDARRQIDYRNTVSLYDEFFNIHISLKWVSKHAPNGKKIPEPF